MPSPRQPAASTTTPSTPAPLSAVTPLAPSSLAPLSLAVPTPLLRSTALAAPASSLPALPFPASLPLLALHGFTGCGEDFRSLAETTADLFAWYTHDLPGHGGNLPENSAPYAPAPTARAIYATLDALRTTPAQHTDTAAAHTATQSHLPLLLGYSMGGRMALRCLAQYGCANICGLILIGASAGLADPQERRARRRADHALAARIEAEGITAFMQYWNSLPLIASQRQSPCFPQLQMLRQRNNAQGLARSLRGIGTGSVCPVHKRLHRITVPCLLLTGEQDTKFTTIARDLAHTLPAAQHTVIPQAGHAPHWENPQATTAAIRNWAQQHFYVCGAEFPTA